MKDIFAASLMSDSVPTVKSGTTVQKTTELIRNYTKDLVVVNNSSGKMIGLFNNNSIVSAINQDIDMKNTKVNELMESDPTTVSPSDSISRVEKVMDNNGLRYVPVRTESNRVVGIVSESKVSDYSNFSSSLD